VRVKRWLQISLLLMVGYSTLTFFVALTVNEKLASKGCLPAYLREKSRTDYTHLFALLRWVPWSATSWCFVEPPIMLLGNQKGTFAPRDGSAVGPKPIPEPGEWQFSVVQVRRELPICFLPYFAFTARGGMHFSVGCRWDDTDHYYVFPRIAIKPIKRGNWTN